MAYLTLQYSDNLEKYFNFEQICGSLRLIMLDQKIFPEAGVRVRAYPICSYSIADGHSENAFIDMILRIGVGRSEEQKLKTGEMLMMELENNVKKLLKTEYLALALEIIEIDSKFSWKTNPIHKRISAIKKYGKK